MLVSIAPGVTGHRPGSVWMPTTFFVLGRNLVRIRCQTSPIIGGPTLTNAAEGLVHAEPYSPLAFQRFSFKGDWAVSRFNGLRYQGRLEYLVQVEQVCLFDILRRSASMSAVSSAPTVNCAFSAGCFLKRCRRSLRSVLCPRLPSIRKSPSKLYALLGFPVYARASTGRAGTSTRFHQPQASRAWMYIRGDI